MELHIAGACSCHFTYFVSSIKYQVSVSMFSYFLQASAKTCQNVFPVCQKPAKAQEEETASADRTRRWSRRWNFRAQVFFHLTRFYLIYGPHLELTFDVLYSNPYSLTPEANCISNRWLAHLSVNNFVVMRMSSAQSSKLIGTKHYDPFTTLKSFRRSEFEPNTLVVFELCLAKYFGLISDLLIGC